MSVKILVFLQLNVLKNEEECKNNKDERSKKNEEECKTTKKNVLKNDEECKNNEERSKKRRRV